MVLSNHEYHRVTDEKAITRPSLQGKNGEMYKLKIYANWLLKANVLIAAKSSKHRIRIHSPLNGANGFVSSHRLTILILQTIITVVSDHFAAASGCERWQRVFTNLNIINTRTVIGCLENVM